MSTIDKGNLKHGEPHPAAFSAKAWLLSIPIDTLQKYLDYFNNNTNSCLSERCAEICAETLRRFLNKEPVSDRYLLGLTWTIQSLANINFLNTYNYIKK